MNTADQLHMLRAIQLAKRGLYTTDPNPNVGCVITNASGDVIGEGWHRNAGEAHAEINALHQIAQGSTIKQAEGSTEKQNMAHTAYVTLEPCCHQGKTGPCSQALIAAKLTRVVVAMLDPNPLVAGKGLQELKAAGIQVESGLLQTQAEALNPGFVKRMRHGLPRVRVKTAMSMDGRTALASGESKWITAQDARADVHRLRAQSSAIVTGIGTVLQDDPSLNVRLVVDIEVLQPIPVILDSSLQIPLSAKIFTQADKVIIYTLNDNPEKSRALTAMGADVHQVNDNNGHTDLSHVLAHLAQHYNINDVMVEAGACLSGAFLQAKLVDELIMYLAPSLLGHEARAAFDLLGIDTMQKKIQLENIQTRMVGVDIRINATINYQT